MSAVTARAQQRRERPTVGRWRALLVLALLAGLLGMHAFAPGGAAAVGARHAFAASAHMGMMTGGDESVCHDDGGGGGHVRHADSTCASGALEAGPVLPALMPDPVGPVPLAFGGHGSGAAALEGGRAPPTPAELQLLRI
ncbi:DUF6153 family protein [Streptomyces sp. NPDC056820]|uniref:DUF6153 family protein n=1 Tax=Streptomyces sp. NPDC056820 TaxID=3345951 RepID=UPI00369B5170